MDGIAQAVERVHQLMRCTWLFLLFALAGCQPAPATLGEALGPTVAALGDHDLERSACRIGIARLKSQRALSGTPKLDKRRIELLGRVRGEPALFVTQPAEAQGPAAPLAATSTAAGRARALVKSFAGRPVELRARVLRDGYLFVEDPGEALALVRELELDDLFEEPQIWLMRGEKIERLERHPKRQGFEYRFGDGEPARLLLFDRVAAHRAALNAPLHRDVRSFRDRAGFDRMRVLHLGSDELLAELTFGTHKVPALVRARGAALELECFDAAPEERQAIAQHLDETKMRRQALAKLRHATESLVRERAPFDRPREVEDHFSDGELRPLWEFAYKNGRQSFMHEEKGYLVFDETGRPMPPETCVAMILDAYERASGHWYRPRGEPAGRTEGGVDFNSLGIRNRAGVISFEEFAESAPALFESYRFSARERVPFGERERFFATIMEHKRGFLPGDVIAIHGPKPDGYVHQHAILVADIDPLTGFPYLLADQMRLPRFRTFEGIMAEAPRRSLLYQVRPTEEMWAKLVPADDTRVAAAGQ